MNYLEPRRQRSLAKRTRNTAIVYTSGIGTALIFGHFIASAMLIGAGVLLIIGLFAVIGWLARG